MRFPHQIRLALPAAILLLALGAVAFWPQSETASAAPPPLQDAAQREFTVTAHKYSFKPPQLDVRQDDLVKITLRTEDIAHSFTIDGYRIAKRVSPGQTVVFEFRADQPGRFPFYCNLTIDDGCKAMRGELIVRAK
ncbi:MAG TPA: cupredoxin domain-containing protein [Vicinamibacterales bacterium]|jgi:heme/copper-type cytochrome/quinol oxidase subunit 2